MASATSNWSVVGKQKKGKGQSQHLSKQQKKQFMENMPRIEAADPVKESSTIYDAFVAKEQEKRQEKFVDKLDAKEGSGKENADGVQKKKTAIKNGRKPEHDRKKLTFEEAVKEISEEELKSVLLQSKEHFPEKSELWLKDLVTYLNMKLESVPETDKYLKPDNKDYPLSGMSKGCVKVFRSVLNDCSTATLEHLLYFCIHTMLTTNQPGVSLYGYKTFLQILARNNPDIVVSKMSQYKDLVKSTQNRPSQCLAILWALGQVGITSLKSGLRVWLQIMLPCLGLRSISGYCIEYLEMILSIHSKEAKSIGGEIKLREYFHLLDLIFGTSLPNDMRKRLLSLYPQLKNIAFGQNLSSDLRNFFPSFLTRATSSCPPSLKTEVLSCLLLCLSEDKHSYALWCQHYTKYLDQSRVVMQYLVDNWETASGKVDKKLLHQTVQSFMRTNEEMVQSRNNSGDWEALNIVCEELNTRLSRPRFPWKWVMFFLVSTLTAIIVYDVWVSKTFKDSRTVRFLEAYGVLGFFEQIFGAVSFYASITYSWLSVNVPLYCELIYNTLSPYVVKFVDFCKNLEEYTRPHRHAAVDWIYALAPKFWEDVGHYLTLCWDFILEYTYWILEHIQGIYKHIYHWVEDRIINGNFSTEGIQDTLTWSATRLQYYTHTAIDWCKQLWT